MDTIFTTLFILFFGAITIIIFIQTNVELWNEIGKDFWNDMKSNITDWFNDTKMGMWYKNKKNRVTILSDREYQKLLKSDRNKNIIIVVDNYSVATEGKVRLVVNAYFDAKPRRATSFVRRILK